MTDEQLRAQGWSRMATYDDPRLTEMVQMYEELGFEVRLEPFCGESGQECSECLRSEPERFKTIYTRKRSSGELRSE